MSLVPIGCSNDTRSMYEPNNNFILSVVTPPSISSKVGDQADYLLVQSVEDPYGDNTEILVDLTIPLVINCPVGEVDNSLFTVVIQAAVVGGGSRAVNYSEDSVVQTYTGFSSGDTSFILKNVGVIKTRSNPTCIRASIIRTGGNPLVSIGPSQFYTKFKFID